MAVAIEQQGGVQREEVPDFAASFQAAATDVLVGRSCKAMRQEKLDKLAVVGGVAANQRLREQMAVAGKREGFQVVFPPLGLCTDNAAMIAAAGARLIAKGESHGLTLNAFSRVPFGDAPWA